MTHSGKTFVEKILAAKAHRESVVPGEVVEVEPDVVLSHDNSAAIYGIFKTIGVEKVKYPERLAITLDHAAPAPTTKHAQNHAEIRRFVAEQGVKNFFEVGRGICHQVLCEEGIVGPGTLLLGADSHSTHYGALDAFGAGVGRSEVAAIWATGKMWLRVPESIKITLTGQFDPWVTSKDIALHIIGELGADGALYASVEFHGDALTRMSMDSRFVLPNMMAEMGAKNAWMAYDDNAILREGGSAINNPTDRNTALSQYRNTALSHYRLPAISHYRPDDDAVYSAAYTFDATALEPQISCPHTVDNVKPLSAVVGTKVDQAFIGTCTNGRLEDIAVAAKIVAGQRIARGTRLLIIPASSKVYLDAVKAGYVETLLEAGAIFQSPGCGPCMGNHLGIPAPSEVTISSANRNFKGRMGTRDADIYLGSPAVVAASAVAGALIHPEQVVS